MLRNLFVIVLVALIASACSSSRQTATNAESKSDVRSQEQREFRVECLEFRDSSRVESLVVLDTLREVTTITITENEAGDTVALSTVTDRYRGRAMADVRSKTVDVRAVHDTVFVAVRDSTDIRSYEPSEVRSRASPVVSGLKWVFWIIVAVIVLTIILKFK